MFGDLNYECKVLKKEKIFHLKPQLLFDMLDFQWFGHIEKFQAGLCHGEAKNRYYR